MEPQPFRCFRYCLFHMVFICCEEQVTVAAAITGAKIRNAFQLLVQGLSYGTFGSLLSGAEEYASNGSPVAQVIYVPVAFSCRFKMTVYPGSEAAHGGPHIGVVAPGEM